MVRLHLEGENVPLPRMIQTVGELAAAIIDPDTYADCPIEALLLIRQAVDDRLLSITEAERYTTIVPD